MRSGFEGYLLAFEAAQRGLPPREIARKRAAGRRAGGEESGEEPQGLPLSLQETALAVG